MTTFRKLSASFLFAAGLIFCLSTLDGKSVIYGAAPRVMIPAHLGRVESFSISKNKHAPVLVIIQDAHAHYAAQKSLSEILKYLLVTRDLSLVMVEGGAGDVDLSELRRGVPVEHAQKVAEKYLKSGKISGEEYLDLTSEDGDIQLWGVEDPLLYARNMEAYLAFQRNQNQAVEEVKKIRDHVRELKIKYYPADLYELETLKERADAHDGSVIHYFQEITEAAEEHSLSFEPYPTFQEWLKIKKKEENLDSTKAELEKTQLVRVLSQLATKEEMYPLTQEKRFPGVESEIAYLRELLELKKAYEHQVSRYSTVHLQAALHAMQAMQRLDVSELFDEAERIHREIRNRVLVRKDARKIALLSDYFGLVEKLFRFEWAPSDEKRFRDLKTPWDLFKDKTLFQGDRGETAQKLKSWIAEALSFYEIARLRENAILKNSVEKIKSMPRPSSEDLAGVCVLIVGGYHANDLAGRFGSKGFSVMNVIPRFEPAGEPSPYFEVLREKWGDGKTWFAQAPNLKPPAYKIERTQTLRPPAGKSSSIYEDLKSDLNEGRDLSFTRSEVRAQEAYDYQAIDPVKERLMRKVVQNREEAVSQLLNRPVKLYFSGFKFEQNDAIGTFLFNFFRVPYKYLEKIFGDVMNAYKNDVGPDVKIDIYIPLFEDGTENQITREDVKKGFMIDTDALVGRIYRRPVTGFLFISTESEEDPVRVKIGSEEYEFPKKAPLWTISERNENILVFNLNLLTRDLNPITKKYYLLAIQGMAYFGNPEAYEDLGAVFAERIFDGIRLQPWNYKYHFLPLRSELRQPKTEEQIAVSTRALESKAHALERFFMPAIEKSTARMIRQHIQLRSDEVYIFSQDVALEGALAIIAHAMPHMPKVIYAPDPKKYAFFQAYNEQLKVRKGSVIAIARNEEELKESMKQEIRKAALERGGSTPAIFRVRRAIVTPYETVPAALLRQVGDNVILMTTNMIDQAARQAGAILVSLVEQIRTQYQVWSSA